MPPASTEAAAPAALPAMSSTGQQSRPGEMAGRAIAAAAPNGPDQATNGAFVGANTELTAAIMKAQRGADGSYRVTALLSPPSLGRVDATIKVDGESVEVAITPHTAEGHEALSRHLDELQRELASEHGVVHLSLTDGGGQARHGNDPRPEAIAARPVDEEDIHIDSHEPTQDSSLHVVL
jgi:flagellar hook-length control protein FliK